MADEIKTTTESQNKLNAALRYGGAFAATSVTFFGAIQFITPDQAAELIKQIHVFNDSILTAYGALTKMWVIAGPVALLWLGKIGFQSSSIKAMTAKLLTIAANAADPKSSEAQTAIVQATNVIALNPQIQTSKEAKVALLDAVAEQPEVVGRIGVTDAELVSATKSEQVQKVA